MKRRHRGGPDALGYAKGEFSTSVAAIPFSQYLEPGQRMEVLDSGLIASDRRRNGEPICRRECPPG